MELEGETKSFDVSYLNTRDGIGFKELLALKCGLKFFQKRLHRTVLWQVDNEATRWAIINQGSAKSVVLNELSLEILFFCQSIGVQVVTQRIELAQNIVADALS